MGLGEGQGEGGLGAGVGEVGGYYGPDLDMRDPHNINDHVKVAFEDVLAEPDSIHSMDCVWRTSYRCFNGCKNCCYKCLSAIFGSCLAMCWGIHFACISFNHIWCLTPYLRSLAINCSFCQRCWGTVLQCFLAPICETCGLCFSRIQVLNLRDTH